MGVPGLMSHVLAHKDACVEYVDLVDRARLAGELDLLVDFYSFLHYLVHRLHSAWPSNPYMCVQGGEYALLDSWLAKIVADLRSVGVRLAFYVDASRGASRRGVGNQEKLATWRRRHAESVRKLQPVLSWCSGCSDSVDAKAAAQLAPLPTCAGEQLLLTARAANCRVLQCPHGEADYLLAQHLRTNPQAVAVLSNDSDFCVFRDSVLAPLELFDVHDDLGLRSADAGGAGPQRPLRLVVGLVATVGVMRLLGFNSWDQLLALSVVAGNDFTGPHVGNRRRWAADLGVRPCALAQSQRGQAAADAADSRVTVADFAAWLLRLDNGDPAKCPAFKRKLSADRAFRAGADYSRQFYSLLLDDQPEAELKNRLTSQLADAIREAALPTQLMPMHLNFYWHRLLLEDDTVGHPTAETAARPLRQLVYRCVLADDDNELVEEWSRGSDGRAESLDSRLVAAAPRQLAGARLPLVRRHRQSAATPDTFADFCRLVLVVADAELAGFDFCRAYGWRCGCLCAVLRHFLAVNSVAGGLGLDEDEALAVCCVALGVSSLRLQWYAGLDVRPSVRCVTVANWWLNTFRTAFSLLAPAMSLPEAELPRPADAFSGSAFAANFMLTSHSGCGLRHLPLEAVDRIRRDRLRVLRDRRHLLAKVAEGYFDFDLR